MTSCSVILSMVSIPDLSNQGRVAGSDLHGSLDDCQRFFDSRAESGMRQLASPLDLDLCVFSLAASGISMDTSYSWDNPGNLDAWLKFLTCGMDSSSCSSMPAVVRCAVDRCLIKGTVLARVGGRP